MKNKAKRIPLVRRQSLAWLDLSEAITKIQRQRRLTNKQMTLILSELVSRCLKVL